MPEVSLSDWNKFLQNHPNAHLLQTGEWGELKSAFGWTAVRIVNREVGAQVLFRKLPLGFTIAYVPKLAISSGPSALTDEFWNELDLVCKRHRAIFLKIEPDAWENDFILHPSSFILHDLSFPNKISSLLVQSSLIFVVAKRIFLPI